MNTLTKTPKANPPQRDPAAAARLRETLLRYEAEIEFARQNPRILVGFQPTPLKKG